MKLIKTFYPIRNFFLFYNLDLKRIFTNKMVSSICWLAIQILMLTTPDQVMYFYRPFPQWVCFLQMVLRNAVVFALLLLIDAIVIARYFLIFWMKNQLSFQDDFWCLFVNTWIIISRFSFFKQFFFQNNLSQNVFFIFLDFCISQLTSLQFILCYVAGFSQSPPFHLWDYSICNNARLEVRSG